MVPGRIGGAELSYAVQRQSAFMITFSYKDGQVSLKDRVSGYGFKHSFFRLFDRFGLSRAPVLENKQIIGLVSYSDIVLKGLLAEAY